MEKTANISNFIGVYDNYITKEECNKTIKLFEEQKKFNNTMNRLTFENSSILFKNDDQFFAESSNIDVWYNNIKNVIINYNTAFAHYSQNTGAHEAYGVNTFFFTGIKIQKTLPTEGYHVWHIEHGKEPPNQDRAFVFTIYLNDVEEGGETEFLHFSKRVKPKTGRIVIWPAGFPYVHRGNPPLSGEKYILTSWMKLTQIS